MSAENQTTRDQFTSATTGTEVASRQIIAWVDFTGAAGTAQLQCEIYPDVWVSVDGESYTDEPTTGAITTEKSPGEAINYRWEVTAYTSGTITTYIMPI